jgi:hypothetical protein
MCTECETESCPCGEHCQNRRFQLHQNANCYPKPSGGKVSSTYIIFLFFKGWGLFAGEYIKKGAFLMQYIGEVFNLNTEEGQIRLEAYAVLDVKYLNKFIRNPHAHIS